MSLRKTLLTALLGILLAPAAAHAKDDPDLWATVNVCDSAKRPDTIGVRASMPGMPRGARLSMRFNVQYRDDAGAWNDVDGADSGWHVVGAGKGLPVESGWSFTFAKPNGSVVLRGVVRFRWRKGDALPRMAQLPTEAGHRSSAGADPSGYSAATCALGS